jgi:lysophospholipase L1-like esterase
MRTITRTAMLALVLAAFTGSALGQTANWVGAWGYVPTTPPPGQTQVAPVPMAQARFNAAMPMGAPPEAQPPQGALPAPGRGPLLENPGGIAMLPANAELANATVRQLVRVSAGGRQIRLRFSNEGSADALPLGAVRVGLAGPDGSVVPGSERPVTFDGKSGVMVPASAPLYSDAVELTVRPLDRLLVSVHLPGTAPRGGHSLFMYVSQTPGDQTAQPVLPDVRLTRVTALVTGVEVNAERPHNAIVTLGDSITEGALSTSNAFRSYPDRLAERLVAAKKNWTVVNAGIGGNRVLRYGTGLSALARFDRDVLSVPGVRAVILLEAINDIGRGFTPSGVREPVTAEALIAGYKQIIARAHARGLRIYGGLLTPYQGAGYASPEGEQVRQAVNNWIRTSGAFDGVIDFATPTADKTNPLAFAPQFNDFDKLHPNDAGYQAMADAIDLEMVTK